MSTLRVNNMTNVGGTGPTYAPGHIIQTVQTVLNTSFSTTAYGFTNITGFAATITPKFTTSKILITVNFQVATIGFSYSPYVGSRVTGGNTSNGLGSGTGAPPGIAGMAWLPDVGGGSNGHAYMSYQYLDSPLTTSATTYQVQVGRTYDPHGGTVNVNNGARAIATITVQEVAA